MHRNLVFAIAAIAVVGLVGFAVMRSSKKTESVGAAALGSASAPEAGAPTPVNVPFIAQAEAKRLFDSNGVTILDVRDIDAYSASHIPGALQIPLSRVEGEVSYLPKEKPIVTYCTCPHDEAAIEAVQILQHGGVRDARVLHGGLQEWTRLGFPTASGLK
jgi:rhodanese-related sulfurtransferase